jgi:anti-sigma B factor antagonist
MTDGDGAAARPENAVLMLAEDEALTVRVRHEPGYVLVIVAGEVDFACVTRLRERLFPLAATGRPLVADLDRVTFIDAAGLGALAGAARRAAAAGTSLRVVCARPRIRWLFRVAGLDQAVSPARTLDEALAMLAPGANAEAV